jgi:hypothetical protein
MNVEIGVSKLNKPAACRAIRSSDTHNSESIIDRNFLQRSRAHAMHSLLLRLNAQRSSGTMRQLQTNAVLINHRSKTSTSSKG